MSRAQRLLDLIQALRQHRRPVSGARLAEDAGVSLRTLYRDIETLKAQGAHIDGEAGVGNKASTRRIIWPFALAFFDRVRMVVAWCELRDGYRHFRTDRIEALKPMTKRYPRRRQALLQEWRSLEGIPEQ